MSAPDITENWVYNYQTQEWVLAPKGVMCISITGRMVFESETDREDLIGIRLTR